MGVESESGRVQDKMRGSESGQKLGKKDIAVFDDITFEKQAEGERSVRFLLGGGGKACQGSGEEDGGGEEGGGGGGEGGGGGKDKRILSRSRSLPATARQVFSYASSSTPHPCE